MSSEDETTANETEESFERDEPIATDMYCPSCHLPISFAFSSICFAFPYGSKSAGLDQSISSIDSPYPFVANSQYGRISLQ